MHEIVLEKEKSYEIINKSTQQIKLSVENNSYKYDKIVYSKNGRLQNTYKDTYGNIYRSESSKVKLSINLQDIKFFVSIDQKNNIEFVEIEGPIIYEFNLDKGSTYRIENTSNLNLIIRNNSSSNSNNKILYDYILL